MNRSPRTAVALIGAALVLAGCAAGPPPAESDDPGSQPVESTQPADPAASWDAPCELLPVDRLDEAFGGGFEDGRQGTGNVLNQGVEWTTVTCSWESADEVDVRLAYADADAFPAGFECVPPSDFLHEYDPSAQLGESAWWVWDDFQGGTGTVIVCLDDSRIELEVRGPRSGPLLDEPQVREAAEAIVADLI